jgi:preprotein translocase subunit YajC
LNLLQILAQTVTNTSKPTKPPQWFDFLQGPMPLLLLGIIVLYFFVFRSKRTQDKQRKDMLANLKRGARVQTIGGIIGTVLESKETEVVLKVDESSNTKMRFARSAIHRVIDEAGEK